MKASDEALSRSRLTVVRCASRNPELAGFAIAAVNRGLDASQRDRTNADMRVDELVELARAILAISTTEARAIFNVADGEAKLVGDDLPARWYALTNTARRLGTGAEPQRAYRLLQVGETLDTDERSDVSQLAKPLFAMHPASYYAAASRQRDRRALSFESLLDPVMRHASGPDGRVGTLALEAFGPRASWTSITEQMDADDAARLDRIYWDFTRPERRAGKVPTDSRTKRSWPQAQTRKKPKTAKIVGPLDFTTAESWDIAFEKIDWYSDVRRKLVRRALGKIPARLSDAIRALAVSSGAREADFVTAATFASMQTQTAGLQAAITYLADAFAERFAASIATRGYDRTELRAFAGAAGVSTDSLLERGFAQLGVTAHTLSHEEYFSLASHIARTLDVSGAAEVFDALAQLFDDMAAPDRASDGPYALVSAAPEDLATCLAGLIWSSLGDMASVRRWEAAHAVLLLVQLGDRQALAELAGFANATNDPAPFYDARFPRYDLHSRLWLLFALERAASESNAASLEPFVPWLIGIVDGPAHAANQIVAQRVLQSLADGGAVVPTEAWGKCLTRRLLAEWEELDWQAQRARKDPLEHDTDPDADGGGYPFFFDFQSHWAGHLARVFGTSEQALAMHALAVAKDVTGYDDDADDPRHAAGVFNQRDSYADHRSWPREEDFTFYSAVHALLALAGQLAQRVKAFKEPGSSHDEYTDWLNEFMPKRRDGRWLSDRRDPPPTPAPERRIAGHSRENWRWSLSPKAFERVVGHGTGSVVVHASYETTFGELSEEVNISSALIPHETARAFLIALQTNAHGGSHFPTTDHDEWDDGAASTPFRLAAWINSATHPDAIDRDDERGRNIAFPPPCPGPEVVNRFGLVPDKDYRVWSADSEAVFRSRVWDNTAQTSREYRSGTSGQKLEVGSQFLTKVLGELDKTLVVQVDLRRNVHTPSYRRKDSDEFNWLEWSSKVYLIDPDGQWTEY